MPKRDNSAKDNMEFTNEEILNIVNEIQMSTQPQKERARIFRRKYPEFAERFTTLFDMVCSPSFDMSCLQSMLALRDRILSKNMDVDSASRIVGKSLFDKYVADKTN